LDSLPSVARAIPLREHPAVRIALFTDTYLPQTNGVSRTLAHLVRYLSECGHEVALVAPRVGSEARTAPPGVALHLPLGGVPVPVYPELLLTRVPFRSERRALERFDPEIVHCATESTVGWSGRRFALRTDRPLVTSFHTNFPEYASGYGMGLLAPLAWRLLRRFHAPALCTLCPSRTTLEELEKRGFAPPLAVWSRGVDSKKFSPLHRSPETRRKLAPGAEVALLYVGRLAPEKRLEVLLQAFPQVRARASCEVALVLVGDGPMGSRIREQGGEGVHATGYLMGQELAAAYASADVFAFPSDTETFGNVVTEAMASGLPVVGVDRGGVRDIIQDGSTGFLVPPGDPDAMAERLLKLVESPHLRRTMGRAARSDAEARGWPRILAEVVERYREAIRSTGAEVEEPSRAARREVP
jgi:phosphatidylinositol alpha 1,6-mannosyltransferase